MITVAPPRGIVGPVGLELRPIAAYAQTVRPHLPEIAFEPAPSRLLWLPVHASVIATLAWALGSGRVPAALWPVASLAIGISMALVAFLGHEILHGAVVRGRALIRLLGWLCLLPFAVSPTLWTNWHNRVHHHHAMQPGVDPDLYPTLAEYQRDPAMRMMADYFGLGGRRWRSLLSLVIGFTGQSQQMLWEGKKLGILTEAQQRRAFVELALAVAFWIVVARLVGGVAIVFVIAIPHVVANIIVMMFILTNHSLSALTPDVNDPLVNSLSVTLPRPLEWLSLDFGSHVEHHLFPSMSARHAPRVRDTLRELYPHRYQSMPMTRAVGALYRSGRVYLDETTLVDPRTGITHPALVPREP